MLYVGVLRGVGAVAELLTVLSRPPESLTTSRATRSAMPAAFVRVSAWRRLRQRQNVGSGSLSAIACGNVAGRSIARPHLDRLGVRRPDLVRRVHVTVGVDDMGLQRTSPSTLPFTASHRSGPRIAGCARWL